MDPATIAAISGAAVAVITAVTALVAQFRHNGNPDAHTPPPPQQLRFVGHGLETERHRVGVTIEHG